MSIELARIGEAIDHLITAPVSNWTILNGIPLTTLYVAARSMRAAADARSQRLLQNVGHGDAVLILSGFIMRDYGLPERTGPLAQPFWPRTRTGPWCGSRWGVGGYRASLHGRLFFCVRADPGDSRRP